MPRHHSVGGSSAGSGSRLSVTSTGGNPMSTTISTLLPPAFHHIVVSSPPSPPRRRLPKGIPILKTPDSEVSPPASATTYSDKLRSSFDELSSKVSRPNIPIVRASATFLSTLSASVALSASHQPPSNPSSAPPSPCLLPVRRPSHQLLSTTTTTTATSSATHLYPPTMPGSSTAKPDNGNVAGGGAAPPKLPSLDFVPASDEAERVAALKLVADSVAQRRQAASWALISHPYFLGIMGVAFAGVYSYLYRVPGDMLLVMTTCVGVLMAGLVSVRAAVRQYIDLAETIGPAWLAGGEDGRGHSEVVVARWGDGADRKVIGALVFSIERADRADKSSSSKKGGSNSGSGGGGGGGGGGGKKVAYVRAWTTRLRERGKGVGKGLVEEAARLARAEGATGGLRYQQGNVYEKRFLPTWAHGGLSEKLVATRARLERYIEEYAAAG